MYYHLQLRYLFYFQILFYLLLMFKTVSLRILDFPGAHSAAQIRLNYGNLPLSTSRVLTGVWGLGVRFWGERVFSFDFFDLLEFQIFSPVLEAVE